METRKKHCSFAVLNSNGRCVADCWMNREREFCSDCTGMNSQAYPTMDGPNHNEVRVSSGAIDGREYFAPVHNALTGTYGIAPKNPPVKVAPVTPPESGDIAYGWGTFKQPDGRIYKWVVDAAGNRVKEYVT